ncbi:FHA domain-containing protein [Pseudarthrobacter sp. 1C304]|uniref:FHA domain-containing protein n=1 Tax=Pseudarthrobacter sp. 1C304 TaxID=3457438 RepID=UPI003FD2C07D
MMASSNPAAAVRYTPGSWLGVVRSETVVLLRPDSGADLIDSLWELLATGPEAHEVLDAVSAASGGSLARLPWFAIVACRGSIQVFLRGEIDLTVDLPSGPAELSGRDVTTWTERRFAAADGFSLTVPGDETAAASGTAGDQAQNLAQDLPLTDGVVLLRGLRMDLTGAAPWAAPDRAEAAPAEPAGDAVSLPAAIPPAATTAALAAGPAQPGAGAAAPDEAATQDEVLAAAEADMAAGLTDHGASAETVLEFPEEDLDTGAPDDSAQDEPAPQDEAAPGDEPAPDAGAGSKAAEAAAPSAQQPDSAPEPAAAPEPAEQEPTSSYDHLWEQTVMRSIEDAAVREDPDAEPAIEPAALPTADSEHRTGPGGDPAGSPETAGPDTSPDAAEPDNADSAPPAASAPEPPAAPRPPLPTGLIDSVPWNTGGDRLSSAAASPVSPPAPPAVFVPPTAFIPPPAAQASAVLPSAPQASAPQAPAQQMPADADHDGQTIMKGDLAGGRSRPAAAPDPGAAPSTGPMVLARVCPQGHANPSTYSQCGRCGAPLPGDGIQVRRPRLGRVRLSTGELIDLDQSLIVGRQPSVSRVQGAVMPKLVQVASPSGDISRSHVEVRLEGWHVMLCDLKATNGTVLIREGQPPRRLAQGEMAILLDGDIADVGDGISLRFEEIP